MSTVGQAVLETQVPRLLRDCALAFIKLTLTGISKKSRTNTKSKRAHCYRTTIRQWKPRADLTEPRGQVGINEER